MENKKSLRPLPPLMLTSGKHDLLIDPPLMNSAGMLGYGDLTLPFPVDHLGAFITNPISLQARTPARGRRLMRTLGGLIMHTGLPNPGIRKTLELHRDRWSRSPVPVILHVIANTPREMEQIVDIIEYETAIAAIEIGLERMSDDLAPELVQIASGSQLPLLARVPVDFNLDLALRLETLELAALVLGPPRGMGVDERMDPFSGRLYGASLLPQFLQTVAELRELVSIPIIGGGGIYGHEALEAMYMAGASAVQIDTLLWNEPTLILQEHTIES